MKYKRLSSVLRKKGKKFLLNTSDEFAYINDNKMENLNLNIFITGPI